MGNKPEIIIKDVPETMSRMMSVGGGLGKGLIKTPVLSQPVVDGKKRRRRKKKRGGP